MAAIGVQGYWLFNQFRYEMCTYADEIAGEVFHAGQEEFRIRKEEAEMTKGTYIIERQSKYQSGDSVLNGLKTGFSITATIRPTTARTRYRSLRTDGPDNPDRADRQTRWSPNAPQRKAVWVDVDLPMNPLLGRMGWQLFLSIFLILLLLACLGFHIHPHRLSLDRGEHIAYRDRG